VPSPVSASAELLAALARGLAVVRASWYLFGAQAVLIWGRPRFTADVDVTVWLEPEESDRLVEALASEEFVLRVRDARDFVARARVLPFVHTPTNLPLDIVLAGPGLEEQFLTRAVLVDIGGVRVPVISPEDLVVTKILAGRPKDLEDVKGILDERAATLNPATIRDTLALLEDALSMNDLTPVFDLEWRRVSSR
jgi:hypothetical protein